MEDHVDISKVAFLLVLFFGTLTIGYLCGAGDVHMEWKRDAIKRCAKVQSIEWCEGRAVLEKW